MKMIVLMIEMPQSALREEGLVQYKGDDKEFLVGGGFVESFAFGGSAPSDGEMGGEAVEMEAEMKHISESIYVRYILCLFCVSFTLTNILKKN